LAAAAANKKELLQRTARRDKTLHAVQQKLDAALATLESERTARTKAEAAAVAVDHRAHLLRGRVAALSSKVAQEERAREAVEKELTVKEEECRLLADVVASHWGARQPPPPPPPPPPSSPPPSPPPLPPMHE